MWRYKRIFIFSALFLLICGISVAGFAQSQTDTSFFLKRSDAYDELLPKFRPSFFEMLPLFVRDTVAFKAVHSERELTIRKTEIHLDQRQFLRFIYDTLKPQVSYIGFDNASRFAYGSDSITKEGSSVVYGRVNAIAEIANANPRSQYFDTLRYVYDRSGRISTICDHMHFARNDTTVCVRYLYDAEGKVVVAENQSFAGQRGTFTYTYDKKNRLTGRRFSDRTSGILFFADTLIYEFTDVAESKTSIKHMCRIPGVTSWILVDEAVVDNAANLLMSYTLFKTSYSHPKHELMPGWTSVYSYDAKGRQQTIIKSDSIQTNERKMEYIWGKSGEPDTLKVTVYEMKNGIKEVAQEQLTVTIYDAKGRISSKTTTINSQAGYGDKRKWLLINKTEEHYSWTN